ncbi:MAG: cysteine hydrolase family protein [Ostreibacterium sp.]
MKQALIVIDFINEIVHPDGKFASAGYADFISTYRVKENLTKLLADSRQKQELIIHIRVGFEPTYLDHPKASPFFGAAKEFAALDSSAWGFNFVDYAQPLPKELIIRKRRINPFWATELDLILRNHHIDAIKIAGCATDLAVESAVRDAHDRDYQVNVIENCCASANKEEHDASIKFMKKLANIQTI